MEEKQEIKKLLLNIKEAVDEKLVQIEQANEEEIVDWKAHYSQVLQDVAYPDM